MTPEGKVKEQVKALLIEYGLVPAGKAANATGKNTGKFHMPVSNGMGVAGIPDFYGHFHGRYFEIETKAPGKKPSALQAAQLRATHVTGAVALVVDGDLTGLRAWLELHSRR